MMFYVIAHSTITAKERCMVRVAKRMVVEYREAMERRRGTEPKDVKGD